MNKETAQGNGGKDDARDGQIKCEEQRFALHSNGINNFGKFVTTAVAMVSY